MFTLIRGIGASGMLAASIALGGCSGATDDLPRRAVSGVVTWEGKPLERGMIRFNPDPSNPHAVQAGAPIEAGRYRISAAEGPVPGTYGVMISTVNQDAIDLEDDPARKVATKPDPIPARYNRKSTLKVELKPDGPTDFDFALTPGP